MAAVNFFAPLVMLIASIAFGIGFLSGQVIDIPKTGGLVSGYSVYDIYSCGSDPECMDQITDEMLQTKSAKDLLAELDAIGKINSDVLYQCHPISHSIGRMLYKNLLEDGRHLGDVFQECDHTCHSGCFHGAMERVFFSDTQGNPHVTQKALREKTPEVCEDFSYGVEGNIRFQCIHGLGHAVLFFTEYKLNESLGICDLLPTSWDQNSCYGGVFMENIFASNKSQRHLSQDPHFPCSAIDGKYRKECYIMQTSRMFELGLSENEIAKECENAGEYSHQCFQSLGRDLSGNARLNASSVTICNSLTLTDAQYCIAGVVYALADNSWDGKYAFPYCDSLPAEHAEYCYKTTVDYLKGNIYISKAAILQSCESYSSYARCKDLV